MSKTILIIEDEKAIQNIIKAFLEDAGYTTVLADDGLEGIEQFHKCSPDLVLLDLMLPKIDGFAVCELIRKESSIPVIMLTARDDDDSQIKGFDALADDYITKPFTMPLVMRRIEAVLRRTEQGNQTENTVIHYKNISLDIDSFTVLVNGENISLTTREFEILKLLLKSPNKVFSREDILAQIWSDEVYVLDRTVDVNITRLRKKVGDYGKCIITRLGYGYCFEDK